MSEIINETVDQTAVLGKEKEKGEGEVDNINKKTEINKYRNLYVIIEQVGVHNSCWT